VVAHKDRLCRFGYKLFEILIWKFGAILTIIENDGIKEPINEFAEDILSIITVFTARYYGSRKYKVM
jgi:predicted site-specific integrase-resolvase